MWRQFDIVQIITSKRVRFLSGPRNRAALPHGNWSIVGFRGVDAVIARQNTVAVIPVVDLRKVASYNLEELLQKIEETNLSSKVNLVDRVCKEFGKKRHEVNKIISKYRYPQYVDEEELHSIIKELQEQLGYG